VTSSRGAFSRREAKGEGGVGVVCFNGGPQPFIGPRRSSGRLVDGIDAGHFGSGKRRGGGRVLSNGGEKRFNDVAIQPHTEQVVEVTVTAAAQGRRS
jgi:hypothetical protein